MFFFDSKGKVEQGNPKKFQELTGAIWVDEMQLPEGSPSPLSFSASSTEKELMQLIEPLYSAYKKSPPKLTLRVGKEKGRHSLCTHEPIDKGTVVTEYLGEWDPARQKRSAYRWGPIDGHHYRNLGGMVEDGFPNLAPFYLYQTDGLPLRVLFIALEEIPAGESLAINYGMNHSVKLNLHTEYRLEPLKEFFLHTPLSKLIEKIKQSKHCSPKELGLKKQLELESLAAKLRYLFQTPSALFLLLLTGQLDREEPFLLLAQPEVRYFLLNFPYYPNQREQELIEYLEQIRGYFQIEQRNDLVTLELLGSIRQRIISTLYLKGVAAGEECSELKEEAYIWNDFFDALEQENKPLAEDKLRQAKRKEQLLKAASAAR